MCGIELHFALSGLGMFLGIEPRALPWAITFGPVGAGHAQFAESAKLEQQIKANLENLNLKPMP
jgi:hypothetical protein